MNRKLSMALGIVAGMLLVESYLHHIPTVAQQTENEADAEGNDEPSMQCPMMAGLKGLTLFADSPEVLRSRAESLKLTQEQIAQLQEIEESARQRSLDVLTDEQRDELLPVPDERLSVMELSRRGAKMKKDGDMKMCPMCQKMMEKMRKKRAHKSEEAE